VKARLALSIPNLVSSDLRVPLVKSKARPCFQQVIHEVRTYLMIGMRIFRERIRYLQIFGVQISSIEA